MYIDPMRKQNAIQGFGKASVSTSLTDISFSGNHTYNSTNQSMEIVSSSANDTAEGTGARTVRVEGVYLNADGLFQLHQEIVTLNGTTPVTLSKSYREVYRASIITSGTYATTTAGAAHGTITIRLASAGATQLNIPSATLPTRYYGQSMDARLTVPHIWFDGSQVYEYEVKSAIFNIESNFDITISCLCNISSSFICIKLYPNSLHNSVLFLW